jgi:hypothetical protein
MKKYVFIDENADVIYNTLINQADVRQHNHEKEKEFLWSIIVKKSGK